MITETFSNSLNREFDKNGKPNLVKWRYLFWNTLWRSPEIYFPVGLLRRKGNVYEDGYDISIDGYPRSGNTYALEMLKLSQGDHLRIRCHKHIPPFTMYACRIGKPVLFLIRKPQDAIVSWSIYYSYPLELSLDYYISYYSLLVPYKPKLFIVSFESLTSNFSNIIEKFNLRYGLHLKDFNEQTLKPMAFQNIDKRWIQPDGKIDDIHVNRPSKYRKEITQNLLNELSNDKYLKKVTKALSLYDKFTSESN